MNRRGFLAGVAAVGVSVSSLLLTRTPRSGEVSPKESRGITDAPRRGRGTVRAVGAEGGTGSSYGGPQVVTPDTWVRPSQASFAFPTPRDPEEAARWIWRAYSLRKPNDYDTAEQFQEAILAEWARKRPVYVWRARASSGLEHVYVLPARVVIAHPPFLPDYPNGYYRLDPTWEADDCRSCVPPTAFFRILPAEEVDTYSPPTPV